MGSDRSFARFLAVIRLSLYSSLPLFELSIPSPSLTHLFPRLGRRVGMSDGNDMRDNPTYKHFWSRDE